MESFFQKVLGVKESAASLIKPVVATPAADSKLEQEKAKDEAIMSSIGEGIIAVGRDDNIFMVNKEAERLLGWKQEELQGKILGEVIPLESEDGEIIAMDKRPSHAVSATGQRVVVSSYLYKKKDGTSFPVAITATPIVLNDTVIGVVVVFRDITEEKKIDSMKTEFISLVSHQLRTPLSAMKWFLEMLLNGDAGELTKDQRSFIESVNESNERIVSLVSALLNITRVESGGMIISPVPTNMETFIKSIVTGLQTSLNCKRQKLELSVDKDLPEIAIDQRLISQVYNNLLTNAIKYSPFDTTISIFVGKENDKLVSKVSDAGFGIPVQDQSKIFKKFYRAENVTKRETDGTGLGLYLAKEILDITGGEIGFTSVENKGTTFWFRLPLSGMQEKKGRVTIDVQSE